MPCNKDSTRVNKIYIYIIITITILQKENNYLYYKVRGQNIRSTISFYTPIYYAERNYVTFEDTKEIIRFHNSNKSRKYNNGKAKKTMGEKTED